MAESTDDVTWWERKAGYGIAFHEHKGNFSLQEGHDYEGSWYPHWIFASKWENGAGVPDTSKKSQPTGVYFGDWDAALDALLFSVAALAQDDKKKVNVADRLLELASILNPKPQSGGDAPF